MTYLHVSHVLLDKLIVAHGGINLHRRLLVEFFAAQQLISLARQLIQINSCLLSLGWFHKKEKVNMHNSLGCYNFYRLCIQMGECTVDARYNRRIYDGRKASLQAS